MTRSFFALLDYRSSRIRLLFIQLLDASLLLDSWHVLNRVLGRPKRLQIIVQDGVTFNSCYVWVSLVLFNEHGTSALVVMVHVAVALVALTPLAMTTKFVLKM